MLSHAVLVSVLAAVAQARFGQEQVPIPAISALGAFGSSGQAATLAGGSIQFLLAAANPCGKLKQADAIVATLGTDPKVIAAARGLAGAEQNFNNFVVSVPNICSDPTLPTTAALRGVVPLVDPAVTGSALENANAAKSLTTPFSASGQSVAEIMAANGFSNFTTEAVDGTKGAAPASGSAPAASASEAVSSVAATDLASSIDCATATDTVAPVATSAAAVEDCATETDAATTTAAVAATTEAASAETTACGLTTIMTMMTVTVTAAASASTAAAVVSGSNSTSTSGGNNSAVSSLGLDFGSCVPTMKFEAGLDGRKDTEFTFQAIDPVVNKGQEEALNPNIITNRICDQLINVCGAAAAAHTACLTAKAQILALGTRDVTTANAWNTALGFAGANTNPDNAPQAGLVGHT